MDEPFILEVDYNGTTHELPAQLQVLGYIHRFVVTVNELDIWFERDEEGAYRAVLPPETDLAVVDKIDKAFLQAVISKIEEVLT